MSFPVTFYEFSKKINSTQQPPAPTTGAGTTWECVLKEASGIVSPQITVNIGLTFEPTGFNYCYIPAFRRYYKVREWFFSNALWTASLDCDVLASYKAQIGASTLYVLRSFSFPNGDVVDNKYPMLSTATQQKIPFDVSFTTVYGAGTYILGILTGGDSPTGAVTYYAMTPTQFESFANLMFSEDTFNASEMASDIKTDLWKSMFNPYQYISSCVWVPFLLDTGTATVKSIKFGWWDMNVSASRIVSSIHVIESFITFPKHPMSGTRGSYLNMSPWSRYILHCMPFGDIPIDGGKLLSNNTLKIKIAVDCGTGNSVLTVLGGNSGTANERLIATCSCTLGVPIPIAQVNSDIGGVAGSVAGGILGTIGQALSGNIAGAIQSATSGIGNAVDNITPDLTGGGTQGSVAAFTDPISLYATFYNVADWDVEHYGRPTMKKLQISSCRGFVQVADGDVSLPATTEECERVRQFLEDGFYYE